MPVPTRFAHWLSALLLALTLATTVHAQPTDTCTASILNRPTRVNPDGTFFIDNIPSNQGLGRVRIICPDVNSTRGGASNFTQIIPGGNVHVGGVPLGVIPPSVKSLAVTVNPTTLTGPGVTAQLSVEATLSDGSMRLVTDGTEGTTYTSSNPAIGTVSPNGLVTAGNQSGTLIVSIVNDGVFASKLITVSLSNDGDGDGLPNDYEEANDCLDTAVPDSDADPDGDGSNNLAEFNASTNPCSGDTDGDGLSDGVEANLGSNPTLDDSDSDGSRDGDEPNPTGDGDGDGLINILDSDQDNDGLADGIEVAIVQNPTGAVPTADNDGDGLQNIDEVQIGTNPANRDTDFDGLDDGEEIIAGTDSFITDPLRRDTDSDGFQDGLEVALKTNPLDANNVPNLASFISETGGRTFSVLNTANPGLSSPVTEATSSTFSVLNATDPGQSSPVTEAVSPTFSVQNQP